MKRSNSVSLISVCANTNLPKMEEQKERKHLDGLTETSSTRVGVPGLRIERTASPERLQQIIQFQKHQMEEKQVKWRRCYLILMLSGRNLLTENFNLCNCRGRNWR